MVWRQAKWFEPLITEYPSLSTSHIEIPFRDEFLDKESEIHEYIGKDLIREHIAIPNLSELVVVRHFSRLAQMSYGIDTGTVPLGSCTMKYNPKICNEGLRVLCVEDIHPEEFEEYIQGLLEILYYLEKWLAEITGMDRCSLQPPAGAAGELVGALMIRKYHEDRGEKNRIEMLIPDNAHGTNPASAAMAGFKVVKIPTAPDGTLDLDALRAVLSDRTAGIMLTNPNTLGIFEKNIEEIAREVHRVGGLLYYDGANLNGILGIARPGDMGFDIVHINIHKTFASPHGGGGPGAGVVCAKGELVEYLPRPLLEFDGTKYYWDYTCRRCIGMIRSYYGNIPALIRAFIYIAMLGPQGLRDVATISVLNSNYFIAKIRNIEGYSLTHDTTTPRKHELVLSAKDLRDKYGVTAEDIAKALINEGVHAPTIYFPLIVEEALMIEFTETEPVFDIDRYVEILKSIAANARSNAEELKRMPQQTAIRRLDLVRANHPRKLILSTRFHDEYKELLRELGLEKP